MRGFYFLCIIVLLINGCAGTGGFREVKFKDDKYKDVKIYGMLDKDFTSKNFGGFQFVFDNTRDQWATIKNIRLSFAEDSATKYIKVLNQRGLRLWSKALLQQQAIQRSDFKQLQSALVKAGASLTGVNVADDEIVDIASSDIASEYPENHLYAQEFILPPNFAVEKWVLLESSNHDKIPYVTSVQLDFEVNNRNQRGILNFRSKSSRYKNFIWFDPRRKRSGNYYMGLNVSTGFPMGDFKEVANSEDIILNGFGLNGYITLSTNLGLNIALDYQSFQARAKLPVDPDSLILQRTDFEFSNWYNISLLISPRFVLPVNLKLDLFAELTGGLVLSLSPNIIARRAGLEIGEIDSENSLSLAAGFAVGSRYVLSKKLSLDIKGEFIPLLEPTFTFTSADNEDKEYTQNMSQLRIKASLNWDW